MPTGDTSGPTKLASSETSALRTMMDEAKIASVDKSAAVGRALPLALTPPSPQLCACSRKLRTKPTHRETKRLQALRV